MVEEKKQDIIGFTWAAMYPGGEIIKEIPMRMYRNGKLEKEFPMEKEENGKTKEIKNS